MSLPPVIATPQFPDFPLVVASSSYQYSYIAGSSPPATISDLINIVLADSIASTVSGPGVVYDRMRSIVGLSQTGGVSIYAGNNDINGPGIRLNANNCSAVTGYPSGSVQMVSFAMGPAPTTLAYENIVSYGGQYNHIFQLTNLGTGIIGPYVDYTLMPASDVFDVTDELGLWDPVDATPRFINGNTNTSSLSVNADVDVYSGASVSMYGSMYPTSALSTAGGFLFTTTGQQPWVVFGTYPPAAPAPTSNMVIANKAVTIGRDVIPPMSVGDVLTVLDNVGFYDPDDAAPRSLNGNTNTGELIVNAHRNPSNGSTLEMFGAGYTGTLGLTGGLKFTTTADGMNGWSIFANYNSGTPINNLVVGNNQTTIGSGIDPTNAFASDVLTVKNQMGFYNDNWATGPFFTNAINGNADKGALQISANNLMAPAQSSNIKFYGNNCGPQSGTLQHFSTLDGATGINGFGHLFYINSGGFAFSPVMGISDQANVTIGSGVDPSWMVPGDFLTLQQQMGFWAPTDATPRAINGNTNTGQLMIHAKTGYSDGATQEMFGSGNTLSGVVQFTTPGVTHESAIFRSYDGTSFHNSLDIWNNGQVAIGRDMDVSVANPGDQLTVLGSLGMYYPGDAGEVDINGNTLLQKLQIGSHRGPVDGSALEMYGTNAAGWPGAIKYTSAGTEGESAIFQNYDAPGTGTGAFHTNLDIWNNGHVTIGHDLDVSMANPDDVLTVYGQMGFYNFPGAANSIDGNEDLGVFLINGNTLSSNGPGIEMYGKDFLPSVDGENRAGSIHFWSYSDAVPDPAHPAYGWMYGNYDPSNTWQYRAAITKDGKMIIGHDLITNDASSYTPGNYSLYVEKGIMCEQVRVSLHTTSDWNDQVFDKNYPLMPLAQLSPYLQKNHHLPGIPSAEDVVKQGVDLGKMDADLLKKIEELTLYVLQQQKRIDELEKKINDQKRN